jgi:membrane-bound lytic murein transglycosylase F
MIVNTRHHLVVTLLLTLLVMSCGRHVNTSKVVRDLDQIRKDTLLVGTLYGATSYFYFRDEVLGFDYEMIGNLSKKLNVKLKFVVARSQNELTQMLDNGKIDIVGCNVREQLTLKRKYNFVFPQANTYQVLVQNIGPEYVSDVTELEGKTVYVRSTGVFHDRLQNLNDEIGGKINMVTVPDSVSDEDLIEMVASKKISYTLAFRNMGLLYKSYYQNIDCRIQIGFNQRNGWLVRKGSKQLTEAINMWTMTDATQDLEHKLLRKYWDRSPYFSGRHLAIPRGALSPFDSFFKKYAPNIDWDWRLLAAVAYNESRFDNTQVSWAGAKGLMQLMPHTAANFGLDRSTVFVPEASIEAATQYIKALNLIFRKVADKDERVKFILASYNSGPSHILDAMTLAEKIGRNSSKWEEHVEYALKKLNDPQYYNDDAVKYGKYSGSVTIEYVQNVLETYQEYKSKTKKNTKEN